MNAKVITAVFATLIMLLASIGVADADAVGDDGEAKVVEPTPSSSFKVGKATYNYEVENNKFPSLADLEATLPAGTEFLGWYVEDETPGYQSEALFMPGSTFEAGSYTAYLKPIEYTVTFVDADGREIATEGPVNYEDPVTVPVEKVGEAEGYIVPEGMVFAGWVDADGNPVEVVDGQITVTESITVKATYKADPVITFIVDGITTYSHVMTGLVYPADPAKDDFSFVGWAVGDEVVLEAGCDISDLEALGLERDTTFTATFEPALHTVTFMVDGVAVSTQTVRHGELAVEPAFVPAKDGYDFAGWDFDFTQPIVADTIISASFVETVAPEPTGLDDPVVLTCVILGGILALIVIAIVVMKFRNGDWSVTVERKGKEGQN